MRTLIIALFSALVATGCTGTPENVQAVTPFDVSRYNGTWYEIARMDHSFERGLSHVTANYSMRDDGGIRVLNRGYSAERKEWSEAEGKAYFVEDQNTGHLKVSFFGPFYGAYVVFGLDQDNYQWAFVTSYKTDYAWLLSRTPQIPESLKQQFIQDASAIGVKTDQLIWVSHDGPATVASGADQH